MFTPQLSTMPKQIKTEADREQKRVYDRRWYSQHSEQVRARNAAQRQKLQRWYAELKATLACQQCGENHPATLVFHHRDPNEKEFSIGQAVRSCWSIERISKEIEKCAVLCTNCHMRLHKRCWD